MPRFFANQENINEKEIILSGDDAKHLRVLHEKPGSQIIVCDGNGTDYVCLIRRLSEADALLDIINSYPTYSEPEVKITLFQGLPKSGKMDLIIQKCVELGVYEIVPVETEFSVAKINGRSGKKTDRWQKISEAAAKQCGRGIIPEIHETVGFAYALDLIKEKTDTAFVAYEREQAAGLKKLFAKGQKNRVGIFIGPEGGFSRTEIENCIDNGITPVSLGKRILRTETAGFMALILLLFMWEEM